MNLARTRYEIGQE